MVSILGVFSKKILLFSRCTVPPVLFHLLTVNDGIKGTNSESPDWILIMISIVELLLPLIYNPGGNMLDSAVCGIVAIVLTFCMLFYVQDRHSAPNGKRIKPFYDILTHWNERANGGKTGSGTQHEKNVPLAEMRINGAKFLLRSSIYSILYVTAFTILNTFIQICDEPPKTVQRVPYLYLMLTSWIPLKTSLYFFWLGITMSLIIAFSALIHLVINSILLNLILWLPASNELRTKIHNDLSHFVEQPPLFDKPWLSRNLGELWSQRWQQAFRPGFVRLGYRPGRRLFPKNKILGRIAGVFGAFLCSGLLHDYIMLAAIGISRWNSPGIIGYQTIFFMFQAVGSIICTASPRLPTWLARALTFLWIFYTGPLFVEPYVRSKLYLFAVVPGNSHLLDSLIEPICPYGLR